MDETSDLPDAQIESTRLSPLELFEGQRFQGT